jgi:hypothetical protein
MFTVQLTGIRLMLKLLPVLALVLLTGCITVPAAPEIRDLDIGLGHTYRAAVVAEDLNNPSSVSFRPGTGALTIADSGNGRVVMIEKGKRVTLIDGFATEYWKKLPTGDLYKIGPLATHWLDKNNLVIAEGGRADGEDVMAWYSLTNGKPALEAESNRIPPGSDDKLDLGEGNYIGLGPDGDNLWVCCHGFDKKSWVARLNLKEKKLELLLSADDHGIEVNSPMQALPWRGNLLVLYSGAGGKDDNLLVEWDLKALKPKHQWKLEGLTDPMGMAFLPGAKEPTLVVTDNNWDLNKVQSGRLALVKLGSNGPQVKIIADKLPGPVSCAFGPDRKLYVACLGPEFDKNKGLVIAIEGLCK